MILSSEKSCGGLNVRGFGVVMQKIVELNPQAVVIDPLDAQGRTIDRVQMHDLFMRLNTFPDGSPRALFCQSISLKANFPPSVPTEYQIKCPKSSLVYTKDELDALNDLTYPVSSYIPPKLLCRLCFSQIPRLSILAVVKQVQASGSLAAHDMGIVWKKEDLSNFSLPMFVQEFVNHDATIFKIYVMTPDSHIITRKSLPNFDLSASVDDNERITRRVIMKLIMLSLTFVIFSSAKPCLLQQPRLEAWSARGTCARVCR
jgi:hypothetical protein